MNDGFFSGFWVGVLVSALVVLIIASGVTSKNERDAAYEECTNLVPAQASSTAAGMAFCISQFKK